MSTLHIDAQMLVKMFFAGAHNLEVNKAWINDLNVFPVPDGDTGTNMSMTLTSAVKELQNANVTGLASAAKAISFGSLRGARGNSGVILSQLLRGFCKGIQDQEILDAAVMAAAGKRAVETAYKAVMKPKEGTILTVARGMAEKLTELAEEETDLEVLIDRVLAHGEVVLAHTPELLPVLKEAGVVDSGGQGLLVFLKGAFDALMGRTGEEIAPVAAAAPVESKAPLITEEISTDDIKFGYCTEFLINLKTPLTEAQEEEFKAYLESLGDSIVMVAIDEIVKVHVHTNDPGLAIQKALTYGGLTNMKIDNMRFEHEEKLIRDASRIAAAQKEEEKAAVKDKSSWKQFGFVATSVGDGLGEIFRSIGVDQLVEGGQTMNPSAADIMDAVEKVPAHVVFVLPNNKNIILAAEQAKAMAQDQTVVVIPTKSVPQGISALTAFIPELSQEENEEAMKEAISLVSTGEVTYAVRNTTINGHEIHENDIMALGGKDGLYAVGTDIEEVTMQMISAMVTEESGMISLYYGQEISEEQASQLEAKLAEAFPSCDLEVLYGGQPIYYYIGSVE